MGKTVREGKADDRKDVVWEIEGFEIRKFKDGDIDLKTPSGRRIGFGNDEKFTLQRKKYTFDEVFKAYENEGKEVESYVTGYRYKKIDGEDCYYSDTNEKFIPITLEIALKEIRGEWYIND